MSNYAIIENGFVKNLVAWDGTGDLFSGFTTLEITSTVTAKIGDAYVSGKIISKPTDGYDYTLDTTSSSWVITATSATQKKADQVTASEAKKESLLETANITISLWQTELLLGSISDTDKASLTSWVAYIKLLQAVDTSTAPNITWPTTPGETTTAATTDSASTETTTTAATSS